MKRYIKRILPLAAFALAFGMSSCTGDLDVEPIDPNLDLNFTAEGLYNKCFGNLATAGNSGGDGELDIDGIDGGTSGFVRQMWNSNELPTDEAFCHWGDAGIKEFCYATWDPSHPMLNGYFNRIVTGISFCNQYLEVASDYDARMTAEVRWLRAFEYYLLMDAFGNIPFSTSVGSLEYKTRQEAYEWIENELLEIEPSLAEARAKKSSDPEYGRPDKAADWLLLSRLYLNAEVYTGTAQWGKAAEYAKKVIDSPYKLNTNGSSLGYSAYQMLFMGDNGETDAAYEGVFPILQDGKQTTSWGCSLFLMGSTFETDMHMSLNPKEADASNGTDQQWHGNRCRPDLIAKFFPNGNAPLDLNAYDMAKEASDDRALFWSKDRTLNSENGMGDEFPYGFSCCKFINFHSDGSEVKDGTYADMDFFILRAAEAYLTYAEATARQNGGTTTTEGTQYVNAIRQRAHAATRPGYSVDELLDEWSREFYFEGRRRVDLIRYGKFTGSSYLWQWKGGAYSGRNIDSYRSIYPLPNTAITGPVVQNPGYPTK